MPALKLKLINLILVLYLHTVRNLGACSAVHLACIPRDWSLKMLAHYSEQLRFSSWKAKAKVYLNRTFKVKCFSKQNSMCFCKIIDAYAFQICISSILVQFRIWFANISWVIFIEIVSKANLHLSHNRTATMAKQISCKIFLFSFTENPFAI